ncbi:MAG TPA: hypothetical protein DCP47_06920 [Phycisphaerales bacterium]|nr:hypothetical protein [Phycisphaerales bacterium]
MPLTVTTTAFGSTAFFAGSFISITGSFGAGATGAGATGAGSFTSAGGAGSTGAGATGAGSTGAACSAFGSSFFTSSLAVAFVSVFAGASFGFFLPKADAKLAIIRTANKDITMFLNLIIYFLSREIHFGIGQYSQSQRKIKIIMAVIVCFVDNSILEKSLNLRKFLKLRMICKKCAEKYHK